jgi:tetratricopeptide (TPR) repeat protein
MPNSWQTEIIMQSLHVRMPGSASHPKTKYAVFVYPQNAMSRTGRNDPCPCGSGKKYKQCCLKDSGPVAAVQRTETASASQSIQIALAHHQAGRLQQAEAIYRQILQAQPDHPDALHFLGMIAHAAGKLEIAIELVGGSLNIQPDNFAALGNLGTLLQRLGRLDEALERYLKAVSLAPDFAEGHYNLGVLLKEQNKLEEAVTSYRRALSLKPDYKTHNNLGLALLSLGKPADAVEHYELALMLKPDYAEAHCNLGDALQELGAPDSALLHYHRALLLKPDYVGAHFSLGNVYRAQNELDHAALHYRRALSLKPDYLEAYCNLGFVLQTQGKLDEAAQCLREAIAVKPDFLATHVNLALVLLKSGDWDSAWEEHEWRWATPECRSFAQPQWMGEAAQGKTLLIHAEQGYGDTLQFCRYAPLAAAQGLSVILEVQKPLVRLLESLPGVDRVIVAGETLPEFDLHCPMLSLPLAFGTTLATVPNSVPYLRADAAQVEAWRARLAAPPNKGIRVGLVWAGSSNLAADRRRSINPERLAPLVALPGIHFFSLQKDGAPAPASFPLTDFMGEMQDFADTAALIANLDLVISVDTAVVHLAGALGKPVWVLDRFDHCWRWLLDRTDSPWYPSLRLFRQPQSGDWESVIGRVVQELRAYGD